MEKYSTEVDIDLCSERLNSVIINAAEESIPKSESKDRLRIVPWWNEECTKAVKDRNRVFRKTLIPTNVLIYQRKHAQARTIIKQAKKRYCQSFCITKGSETQLREVWSVLKKMVGVYRNQNIPVWIDEGEKAVTGEEKAELLAFTFQKAHSTDNLEENYKRSRQYILKQHQDINAKNLVV